MQDAVAPLVSVVMIFFNSELYIREAIESVLGQEFADFELLLVDDGSIDSSSVIAKAYVSRYPSVVRYLEHERHANRGMSATRNLGLRHALGKFVALIDSDDLWSSKKLAEQLRIMESHPELGMVCGTVRYWKSWSGGKDTLIRSGAVQDRVIVPPEASLGVYPLGSGAAPCPSDLLIRRDVALSIGGFEEQFTGPRQLFEDQAFLAKLYLVAPVYFAQNVWLDYRQHANSCVATVVGSGQDQEARQFFFEWLSDYISQRPGTDSRVRFAVNKILWRYRHRYLSFLRQTPSRVVAGLRRRMVRAYTRAKPAE